MRRLVRAFAFAWLIACGGKAQPAPKTSPEPTPPTRAEKLLAKLTDMKAQMCACKDAACVDHVNDDFMTFVEADVDLVNNPDPTPEQSETISKLNFEVDDCQFAVTGHRSLSREPADAE
jgi:hypothetical protein